MGQSHHPQDSLSWSRNIPQAEAGVTRATLMKTLNQRHSLWYAHKRERLDQSSSSEDDGADSLAKELSI